MESCCAGEDKRTTLMVKNIPNKYTQKMLLATIDEQFKGQYDFFYLPIDFKNKCNVGYAFLNMVWSRLSSTVIARVTKCCWQSLTWMDATNSSAAEPSAKCLAKTSEHQGWRGAGACVSGSA